MVPPKAEAPPMKPKAEAPPAKPKAVPKLKMVVEKAIVAAKAYRVEQYRVVYLNDKGLEVFAHTGGKWRNRCRGWLPALRLLVQGHQSADH